MKSNKKNKSIVSIKEIAREADVSIATVSNVINKSYKVTEKTKKRVEDIIKKYNYRINIGASSLRSKVSKLIGVIVPEISNPLFSKLNDEIEKYASEIGYSIVICNNNYDYKKDIEHIEMLESRNVDGLIMIPSIEDKKVLVPAIRSNIPTVLINSTIEKCNCDAVVVDIYKAVFAVVNYLASLGHKKILYTNEEPSLFVSQERLKGYIDGLKNNGLILREDLIMHVGGFRYEDGYNFVKKILELKDQPTAIIAYGDMLAIGIIKAIFDSGLKVPENYSVIGFDNITIDDYLGIRLTSVAYGIKDIARAAIDALLDRIKYKDNPEKLVILPLSIKKRESVGMARG